MHECGRKQLRAISESSAALECGSQPTRCPARPLSTNPFPASAGVRSRLSCWSRPWTFVPPRHVTSLRCKGHTLRFQSGRGIILVNHDVMTGVSPVHRTKLLCGQRIFIPLFMHMLSNSASASPKPYLLALNRGVCLRYAHWWNTPLARRRPLSYVVASLRESRAHKILRFATHQV